MYVRMKADEDEERRDNSGHDRTGGGWGSPPPAHILKQLPGWQSPN